jgi:hypothetical protein
MAQAAEALADIAARHSMEIVGPIPRGPTSEPTGPADSDGVTQARPMLRRARRRNAGPFAGVGRAQGPVLASVVE